MRKTLLFLISLTFAATSIAAPRTRQAMLQAAQRQFSLIATTNGRKAPAMKPELLRQDSCFAIYGYQQGGFVVVSSDDLMPEILGYSDAGAKFSNGDNKNFEWWLEAVRQATREAIRTNTPRKVTRPDASRFQTDVAALVTCSWGQDAPYNDLCPNAPYSSSYYGSGTARAVTGCVATAMAQILYYHKAPVHGVGTHSVGVPFDYPTATYTFDFENATFDYDNMLDSYSGSYSATEGNAVATLMYACGVASDMQYAPDGSGTYTQNASDGLKRNFGLSDDVHVEDRADYSEADWMDLVYTEVDAGRPILYTGVSGWSGGHAFVLDGYNNQGQVHINWGWDGSDNGMFDIATLAVESYSFSSYQDMCIGISPERQLLTGDTIMLAQAGTLADSISSEQRLTTGVLKVSGNINSTDLGVIRYMAGVDTQGNSTKGKLNTLDLSEAHIVSGGNPYLYEGTTRYTTDDNVLPERAFYGTRRLSKLSLPKGIRHIGDGALAVAGLRQIDLEPAADADFFIDDGVLYSKADTSEIIAVMPTKSGYFDIPAGTKTLHPYAMANCRSLAGLRITATVDNIGAYALANMTGLTELRMYAKEPPVTGDNAVTNLNFRSCKLYVPAGSKTRYSNHSQWGQFRSTETSNSFDNIVEFGTRVKARNAFKIYGAPAPRLGYKIEGDPVHGDPEVSSDVNELTPVGRCPIRVTRGTIRESEGVEYSDGYCIVAPDTLFVTVGEYTRDANEPDPEFSLTITGFDNGEDESVIEEMPVATPTSTPTSPAGEYEIVLSGGKAQNYIFQFTNGKLTITGVVDGIDNIKADTTSDDSPAYNLAGQRVGKAYRGIVIVGGKKLIRK